MANSALVISSKNYSSWSLRGWLLARMSGLKFEERVVSLDNSSARAEILLLSPSILVPCLNHNGLTIWDTVAIGEYLNEIKPAGHPILPEDAGARARSRSICGEMHSGFTGLRSALPMNLKRHYPNFKIWAGALADIERITDIWRDCLSTYGGPYLFGATPTMADAMYAPVVHPLPDLRREARQDLLRLLRPHHGDARHGRVDRSRQARAGRVPGTGRGVLMRQLPHCSPPVTY